MLAVLCCSWAVHQSFSQDADQCSVVLSALQITQLQVVNVKTVTMN